VNPGDGSGWDEPPLDVQIPDDARELERDVLAYHRELRARRRRHRLRRLAAPLRGPGTVMPLLASTLAVCLVAGAMLSVATFSPATGPEHPGHPSATAASGIRSGPQRTDTASSGAASSGAASSGAASSGAASSGAAGSASASPVATSPGPRGSGTARPSGSANAPARSTPPASATGSVPGAP